MCIRDSAYDGRDFPWRLALPPTGSPATFSLRWGDHVTVDHFETVDAVVVRSLDGEVPLPLGTAALVMALVGAPPRTRDLASERSPFEVATEPLAVTAGEVVVRANRGTVDQLLDTLEAHVRQHSVDDLTGVDVRQDLREVIDALIGSRALWWRPA